MVDMLIEQTSHAQYYNLSNLNVTEIKTSQ